MIKIIIGVFLVILSQVATSNSEWFIELPNNEFSALIEPPAYESTKTFIAPEPPFTGFLCGLTTMPELELVDQLLNDPKTIDFTVGKTYEVYIPIMGKEPVKTIRHMQVVDRKFNTWWAQ